MHIVTFFKEYDPDEVNVSELNTSKKEVFQLSKLVNQVHDPEFSFFLMGERYVASFFITIMASIAIAVITKLLITMLIVPLILLPMIVTLAKKSHKIKTDDITRANAIAFIHSLKMNGLDEFYNNAVDFSDTYETRNNIVGDDFHKSSSIELYMIQIPLGWTNEKYILEKVLKQANKLDSITIKKWKFIIHAYNTRTFNKRPNDIKKSKAIYNILDNLE